MISISENYIAYQEDSTWFPNSANAAFRLPHWSRGSWRSLVITRSRSHVAQVSHNLRLLSALSIASSSLAGLLGPLHSGDESVISLTQPLCLFLDIATAFTQLKKVSLWVKTKTKPDSMLNVSSSLLCGPCVSLYQWTHQYFPFLQLATVPTVIPTLRSIHCSWWLFRISSPCQTNLVLLRSFGTVRIL